MVRTQMPDVSVAGGEDVVQVAGPVVGCDGGGGPLGHPMVYLRIEREGQVVCPYCSRRFVQAEGIPGVGGH